MPNCRQGAGRPRTTTTPTQPFDPDLPLDDDPTQGCHADPRLPRRGRARTTDEPCRSDLDARTNCEGGTDGTPTALTAPTGGTDGTPDDGTTGGSGGRLPKTGVEIH